MSIYPKASAPATEDALRMANARAARWYARYEAIRAAVAEIAALEEERAEDLRDDHSAETARRLRAALKETR